jgi:hypothetical protein
MTTTPHDTSDTSEPNSTPNASPDSPAPAPAAGSDVAVMPVGSLAERLRYAEALASAGDLIPKGLRQGNVPNVGKVLLVIETGAMLGIHPVAALNGVNIIEGKATLAPSLMSALVRRAGHTLRVRTTGVLEEGTLKATATLIRADDRDEPFEAVWTPARAARAGLCTYAKGADGAWAVRARTSTGNVKPWEAYTEAMLKARAMGEVCREGAEDALMGVHYTPEELGATVDADGVMVDLGIVEAKVEREPDLTPEAVASQARARALAMPDVASVVGVWRALPNVIVRNAWAGDYADLMDFATRTLVEHPYEPTADRVPLLAAFTIIRERLEGGSAAPQETPAPAGDDTGDTVVEPTPQETPRPVEDIVDAEVEPTPGDDPWADGTAQAGQGHYDETPTGSRHDAAVKLVTDELGGQVLDDGNLTRTEAAAAEHAEDVATRERTAPQSDLGGAATGGAGKAALAQARAELEAKNAARTEREAQARRARKAGQP